MKQLGLKLIFLLINSFAMIVLAEELPTWVKSGKTMDNLFFYISCNAEDLDPQKAQELAEAKCFSSAAKLGGVTVTTQSKTVNSLTGADSSESSELTPLIKNVNCEFTDRFLEKVDSGFRIWLRCKVKKTSVNSAINTPNETLFPNITKKPYKRVLMTVITKPKADVLLVGSSSGERAIDVNSNVMTIEVNESDEWIIAKRSGYKDHKALIPALEHGNTANLEFNLKSGL